MIKSHCDEDIESLNFIRSFVRDIPDFPEKGVLFRDITPLLANGKAYQAAIQFLLRRYKNSKIDCIVGVEARGFFFGAPLAVELGVGFIPARKAGKLPRKVASQSYELEYGRGQLEIHDEDVMPNAKVLVVDDLLATGGTTAAVAQLIKSQNAEVVEIACVIELEALNGRKKLSDCSVYSMLKYS